MYKTTIMLSLLIISTYALPQFTHPAVLETAALEDSLPSHLKNPFYRTPRVREALAKNSWFGPGEHPVQQREAEKIPRAEIYAVLTHAGLVPRRFSF